MLTLLKAYHHEEHFALVVSLLIKGTLKRLSLRAVYAMLELKEGDFSRYRNVMASSVIIEILFTSDG